MEDASASADNADTGLDLRIASVFIILAASSLGIAAPLVAVCRKRSLKVRVAVPYCRNTVQDGATQVMQPLPVLSSQAR